MSHLSVWFCINISSIWNRHWYIRICWWHNLKFFRNCNLSARATEKQHKNNTKTIRHHTKQHKFTNFDQYIPSKQRNLKIARARYVIHTWYTCIFWYNLHQSIDSFSAKSNTLHTTQKPKNFAKIPQKQ